MQVTEGMINPHEPGLAPVVNEAYRRIARGHVWGDSGGDTRRVALAVIVMTTLFAAVAATALLVPLMVGLSQ